MTAAENVQTKQWVELPESEGRTEGVYFIGDDEVWVTRVAGTMTAISNICTHKLGPINIGPRLADNCAQCPWHGYDFDLTTGQCKNYKIPNLRLYDIKVESGTLWVRLKA